jgi:hypothetical protein
MHFQSALTNKFFVDYTTLVTTKSVFSLNFYTKIQQA